VIEDRIVFGSEDGVVHCAYRETGEILWSFPTGDRVPSSPSADGGTVYAASYDGFLYALDPDLGHPSWRTQVGASVYSSPAAAGGKLFLGTNQGRFLALFLGR
jgi:outer membrane protein assembly factor BamB